MAHMAGNFPFRPGTFRPPPTLPDAPTTSRPSSVVPQRGPADARRSEASDATPVQDSYVNRYGLDTSGGSKRNSMNGDLAAEHGSSRNPSRPGSTVPGQATRRAGPRNELLEEYSKGRTPQEGLILVANRIGEFLALINMEIEVSGLFIMPETQRTLAQVTKCGTAWYMGVPVFARPGFEVPPSGSWQDPNKPAAPIYIVPERDPRYPHYASSSSSSDDDSPPPPSRDLPRRTFPLQLTKTIREDSATRTIRENRVSIPQDGEDDPDLAIHVDDAPVTRELNRSFKDSEVVQAAAEIKRRNAHPKNLEEELKKLDWPIRKRTCHLHTIAFLYDRLGNSNFQEIPYRLRKNRYTIHGWPADCDYPRDAHIGVYNSEKVKNLLLAIWRGTMTVKPWTKAQLELVRLDPEKIVDVPLFIDTSNRPKRFPANLDEAGNNNDDPADEESDAESSVKPKRKGGRPRKSLSAATPPSKPSKTVTPKPASKSSTVVPPKSSKGLTAKSASTFAITAPRRGASKKDEPASTTATVYQPKRDYSKPFGEKDILAAQKVLDLSLKNGQSWADVLPTEWNAFRRACGLHVAAFLYEGLGNGNFKEAPQALRAERRRIIGWPADCDVPSRSKTHCSTWNKQKVEAMLSAIWKGTIKMEDWKDNEKASDYPVLLINTSGKKFRFKDELEGEGTLKEDKATTVGEEAKGRRSERVRGRFSKAKQPGSDEEDEEDGGEEQDKEEGEDEDVEDGGDEEDEEGDPVESSREEDDDDEVEVEDEGADQADEAEGENEEAEIVGKGISVARPPRRIPFIPGLKFGFEEDTPPPMDIPPRMEEEPEEQEEEEEEEEEEEPTYSLRSRRTHATPDSKTNTPSESIKRKRKTADDESQEKSTEQDERSAKRARKSAR